MEDHNLDPRKVGRLKKRGEGKAIRGEVFQMGKARICTAQVWRNSPLSPYRGWFSSIFESTQTPLHNHIWSIYSACSILYSACRTLDISRLSRTVALLYRFPLKAFPLLSALFSCHSSYLLPLCRCNLPERINQPPLLLIDYIKDMF